MDKLAFMRLWDLYGKLLTPTQREITDMYFNLDLTVSEIAEQKGVSRQSISECLHLCMAQLAQYEEKLSHARLLDEDKKSLSCMAEDVGAWADDFSRLHPAYAADIAALRAILQKYSADAAHDKAKD